LRRAAEVVAAGDGARFFVFSFGFDLFLLSFWEDTPRAAKAALHESFLLFLLFAFGVVRGLVLAGFCVFFLRVVVDPHGGKSVNEVRANVPV